jgi:hypothetical protein
MAFLNGSEEEVAGAKRTWKELAVAFWTASADAPKMKPLCRTKTYEWLCATEHILCLSTGARWSTFKPKVLDGTEDEEPPEKWRTLVCALDQGSDGWSATWFLIGQGVCILPCPDQSHRIWNDAQLSLKDAGLYHLAFVSVVLLNLDCGPWETARWWETLRAGSVPQLYYTACGHHVADMSGILIAQHYLNVCSDAGPLPYH